MRLRSLSSFIAGSLLTLSIPVLAAVGPYFSDVRGNTYYQQAVTEFALRGILRGFSDGTFRPNSAVTRAELAVILDRYDRTVADPLRAQIREIQEQLRIGTCGDGSVDNGEQCDDGGLRSGDGCTRDCQREIFGSTTGGQCGQYNIGDRVSSGDSCNTCTCTSNGIVCTDNDCNRRQSSSCRDYICENGKTFPRCTDSGRLINYFLPPCHRDGGEEDDDDDRFDSCDEELRDFEDIVDDSRSCQRDSDCMLFEESCPFVTCGEAINEDAEDRVEDAADDYIDCKERRDQPTSCADCERMEVSCDAGKCRARRR